MTGEEHQLDQLAGSRFGLQLLDTLREGRPAGHVRTEAEARQRQLVGVDALRRDLEEGVDDLCMVSGHTGLM